VRLYRSATASVSEIYWNLKTLLEILEIFPNLMVLLEILFKMIDRIGFWS